MQKLVELARQTIELYVKTGKTPALPDPLEPELKEKAGVFVSIKKNSALRGCIGTFSPCAKNIAAEIIANAVAAATRDPRFHPVTTDELPVLVYSVDVLSPPEKITEISELDPKKFGIIIKSGSKRGLLLPDLEGVDTVEEQISITKKKAGILQEEETEIYRFSVRRYT